MNSMNAYSNMNIQSSQSTPPPLPPPPPQQPIVVPLNSTLHPPLIPAKPFSSSASNTNNTNNMMNIRRSNSTNSFQGMETGNLSGPGGNINSSLNVWNSTSKLDLLSIYTNLIIE